MNAARTTLIVVLSAALVTAGWCPTSSASAPPASDRLAFTMAAMVHGAVASYKAARANTTIRCQRLDAVTTVSIVTARLFWNSQLVSTPSIAVVAVPPSAHAFARAPPMSTPLL